MVLHLAHPIDMSDPLLMSDDERRAFLTPIPRSELDAYWKRIESPVYLRFSSDVRQAARRVRDARLRDLEAAA